MTLYYAKDRIEKAVSQQTDVDYAIATPGKIKPGTTYKLMLIEFTIYCVKGDTRFELKEVFEVNGGTDILNRNTAKIDNIIRLINLKLHEHTE